MSIYEEKGGCISFIIFGLLAYMNSMWGYTPPGYEYLIFCAIFFGGPLITIPIISHIAKKYDYYKENIAKCKHGVKGGISQDKCGRCIDEREKQERKTLEKKKEQERLAEIKIEAIQLKRSEEIRVTKAYIQSLDRLHGLHPNEFEDFTAKLFTALGYEVEQTEYVNDQGKDAIMYKDGKKYLVECKKYAKDKHIGRPMLQKLFAAMNEEAAEEGFFVTTAKFSKTSVEYGEKYNIKLIDGEMLLEIVNDVYADYKPIEEIYVMCPTCGLKYRMQTFKDPKTFVCANNHQIHFEGVSSYYNPDFLLGAKVCKKCGAHMRLIKNRGSEFWGCTNYPKCRYTKKYSR